MERALTMLDEIAASESPPSATEIARRAGVNRATAWRLLVTLEHFDLVERDPRTGTYTVGYGAARIARVSGASSLVRVARPVLEKLGGELKESVYLQVASGRKLIVLDEVRAANPVQVDLANLEVPLHCGSAGKVFLAFLPDWERDQILAEPLEAFTERTVTDPDQLRAELERVRADRFAVAYQEHLPDWGGATAAVCDRRLPPLAYFNVTVPSYRYTEAGMKKFRTPLRNAARELEQRLLYRAA
ncbi:MAG: IclR family transcriptional regulator [Streptosporangiales bacterium]|nr:IclR family transcriptional regulator [Streptosporangiales bacterium]